MVTIEGVDGLKAKIGEEVAVSDWRLVDQAQVDAFAEVTGDHQYIHVDPERAKDSPFGGTIAHGYFTLALHPVLLYSAIEVTGFKTGVNYGLNKVRFVSPLPVGERVRLRATISDVQDIEGGVQITWAMTWEREGAERPVCIAESVTRQYK